MRVLVVHSRYRSSSPSGENAVVDRETAALRGRGHVVELFQRTSDEIASWPRHRRATLAAQVVWNPAVDRELRRVLNEFRPDVSHVHNTFPLISPSVLYACKRAGVPVVATLHNYKLLCASGSFYRDGEECSKCAAGALLPALAHRCYRKSWVATAPVVASTAWHRRAWRQDVAAYICISGAQREALAGLGLPAERTFVKWNLIPWEAEPAPPLKSHRVSYVGRLDEAKGIPLLMRAWDTHRAAYPAGGLRLTIAGRGPLEGEVRTWAADRVDVECVGQLTPDEVKGLLVDSRAVLIPSAWRETFGLVAIEAMAATSPPFAPAHGAFPELIRDGADGLLFPPGKAVALADLIGRVEEDPGRFLVMGRRSRRRYEQSFDPDANIGRLEDIYRFATAGNRVPAPRLEPA